MLTRTGEAFENRRRAADSAVVWRGGGHKARVIMDIRNGTGLGTVTALDIAHKYFDGWNRRDANSVLETMAPGGTYSDPQTGGPLSGEPFREYMNRLFMSFPDVSFEIASDGLLAPDLVAAQWIMRGTNTGSMMGLPF